MSGAALRVLVAVAAELEPALVQAAETSRELEVVHRCVDLTELLAVASTGRAEAAFISADLRHLDRVAVARMASEGIVVIGIAIDPDQGQRLAALGVTIVLTSEGESGFEAADLVDAVHAGLTGDAATPATGSNASWAGNPAADPALTHRWTGGSTSDSAAPNPILAGSFDAAPEGKLVAVWGPAGSPGRTTVAVNLAAEFADRGISTLLADADTYAASVAQSLGVLDEAPGVAAACRAASAGQLDLPALARLSPEVSPNLRVLTGISRSDRWPELAGPNLEVVWSQARRLAAWTIVDVGFCTEADEELSYDSFAPRRNAATLVSLEQADLVIAVGAADPVGLQRLIRGLADLAEFTTSPLVVVTKCRAGAVGADPVRRVRASLQRFAGVAEVLVLPDDREGLDAAMLAGRCLVEVAPRSALRNSFRELADRVSA